MSRRNRIVGFGSAGALVVAGIVCAVLVGGTPGQILTLILIALGLVLATALVFFEVGLSEDRDRAQEEALRARADPGEAPRAQAQEDAPRAPAHPGEAPESPPRPGGRDPAPRGGRARPRLERMRGRRRRLS